MRAAWLVLLGTALPAALFSVCEAASAQPAASQREAPAAGEPPPETAPTGSSASGSPPGGPSAAAGYTDLPAITVETRRPRRKPPAKRPPASPAAVAATAPPGPVPPAPDSSFPFAPLSALSGNQVATNPGQSFGNLFFARPGATSAGLSTQSARPVLRGLSDARVRVQENGVGAVDVSDIAQDHGVPIDPLATQHVEILRGPAALRFGSQAVGGIVEAGNNRIPTAIPAGGLAAEMRSAVTTVDRGWESGLLLDAGGGSAAFHADVYGRKAGDYGIPGYPYLTPPNPRPAVNGRQPNSAMESAGAAVGGSYLFDGGYAGLSVSRFTSDYHVPGLAAASNRQHNDLQQTKVVSKGEYRPDGLLAAVRYWTGYSDYRHDEIDFIGGTETIGATFKNRQAEGKIEAEAQPAATPLGPLRSIIGAQTAWQWLDTSGQAIMLPAQTRTAAGYFFEEIRHTDTLRSQLAGRIEAVDIAGTAFSFPSPFVPPPDSPASVSARSGFTPKSVSFSVIKDLPSFFVASLGLQRVERAPRALELFASGPDDSEKTFKIGNASLTIETANSAEAGLARMAGDFRFDARVYYTHYDKFIFAQSTGNFCGVTFATCGATGDYIQVAYAQRDADFRGGELAWQWDAAQLWNGTLGVEGQFDVVRATFSDGTNVPRIPPMRAGGGFYWRNDDWSARVNLVHAFAQRDYAAFDTATSGYDLLKLQVEHRRIWKDSPWGRVEVTTGVAGDNLLNADIRNAVQFHKDEILQPGRTFKLFVNVRYGADGQ